MICPECKKQVSGDAAFCTFCGASLARAEARPARRRSPRRLVAAVVGLVVVIAAAVLVSMALRGPSDAARARRLAGMALKEAGKPACAAQRLYIVTTAAEALARLDWDSVKSVRKRFPTEFVEIDKEGGLLPLLAQTNADLAIALARKLPAGDQRYYVLSEVIKVQARIDPAGAVRNAERVGEPSVVAYALSDVAIAVARAGRMSEAQKLLERALDEARTSQMDESMKRELINNIEARFAIVDYGRGVRLAGSFADPLRQAAVFREMGESLSSVDPGKAAEAFDRCLEAFARVRDPSGRASSLFGTALALDLLPRGYGRSATERVLQISEKLKDKGEDWVWDNRATFIARVDIERGLRMSREMGGSTTGHVNIAGMLAERGEIERAWSVAKEIGDPETRGSAFVEVVKGAALNQPDKAEKLLTRIKDRGARANATAGVASALVDRWVADQRLAKAREALAKGNVSEARLLSRATPSDYGPTIEFEKQLARVRR